MKIGTYNIPLNRLDKMLQATKKIHDEFRSDEVSKKDIGPLLGHDVVRSGALGQKIADMRAYGLLEGGRDKFRVTKIGVDALWGTSEEKSAAIQQAVRNIPLWSVLLDRYGSKIKEENFWVNLRKITGVESADARKNASAVRNAYMADVNLMGNIGEPTETFESQELFDSKAADGKPNMEAQQIGSEMAVISIESEGIRNRLVIQDLPSYDFVIDTLTSLKKKLNLDKKTDTDRRPNQDNEGNNGSNKIEASGLENKPPTIE